MDSKNPRSTGCMPPSKSAITLTMLNMTTVIAVLFSLLSCTVNQSPATQNVTPSDLPPGKIAIHYRYQRQYCDLYTCQSYDFWQRDRNMESKAKNAFSPAKITFIAKVDTAILVDIPWNGFYMGLFYGQNPPNISYPYFVFGAGVLEADNGDTLWDYIGASSPLGSINDDPPGEESPLKYSYVFTLAIDRKGKELYTIDVDGLIPAVLIHELGHVKAGLRHPNEYPQLHVAQNPEGSNVHQYAQCAMWQLKDMIEWGAPSNQPTVQTIVQELAFCGRSPYNAQGDTSCIHFLVKSNQ